MGGPRARRSLAGSLARALWRLLILASSVVLVVALAGKLPSGTGTGSLAVRAGTGAAAGLVLIGIVRRSLRALGESPPAPPEQVDARAADVVYECPVCGTRVRLEVAVTGKPPRHCGEEMDAKLA